MNYRVEIHPVQFRKSGRTIKSIHVYFDGEFLGSAYQARIAANLLAAREVPYADAMAAIDQAKVAFNANI